MANNEKDGYTTVSAYQIVTDEKKDSLGQEMTLKEVLDLWWNRVDFYYNGKQCFGYKVLRDKTYHIEENSSGNVIEGKELEELLKQKIQLDNEYDIDEDGYPIIFGDLAQNNN